MTIKRVKAAAGRRGIYFDGVKKFRNTMVGVAYEIFTPDTWSVDHPDCPGFCQADTLEGLYRVIMKYPVVDQKYRY